MQSDNNGKPHRTSHDLPRHLDRGCSAGAVLFESELNKIETSSTCRQLIACNLSLGIGRQQLNRLHHLCRDIMPVIKTAANWKKLHWISGTIVGLYLWMMVGWGSTRKLDVRPVCITLPSAQVASSLSHPDRTRAYQSPPLGRSLWYLHGESGGQGQEINRKHRACHKHIDETRHIDQTNYSIMNYFSLEFRTFGNISNMYRSKHMISYIVH